jgi:hypothetical protein
MKNFILLLCLFGLTSHTFSYTWQPYGPEGIEAKNFFFIDDYFEPLLIMDGSGFYLSMDTWPQSWQYFDYPAKEAVQLNGTSLLFVAGNGSYSDGIYTLHIPSQQIELVEYCINPHFIKYFEDEETYYAGYDDGLLRSTDGLGWEEVDFFTGRMCIGMEYAYGHWIVNTVAAITHLFLSTDNGNTWTESTGNPGLISAMAFSDGGKLYGVFPSTSYSSGLWSSEDYGDNWEIEFYTLNLNTVHTVFGESLVFTGWSEPDNDYKGIAIYDPWEPEPDLIFLNEGLPNTSINQISYRSIITKAAHLYVCTNEGVFVCSDYFVGINDLSVSQNSVQLIPNPVQESTIIKMNGQIQPDDHTIIIMYNNIGIKVDELYFDQSGCEANEITWSKGNLPAGIYYLVVRTKNETFSEKFIIL